MPVTCHAILCLDGCYRPPWLKCITSVYLELICNPIFAASSSTDAMMPAFLELDVSELWWWQCRPQSLCRYDHWVMTTTPPLVNIETKFFLSPIDDSSHCIVQRNREDVRCQGVSLQNPSLYFKENTFSIQCYDSSSRPLVKEANLSGMSYKHV